MLCCVYETQQKARSGVRDLNGVMVIPSWQMAESLGFEPKVGYQPTHDFQTCGAHAPHQ